MEVKDQYRDIRYKMQNDVQRMAIEAGRQRSFTVRDISDALSYPQEDVLQILRNLVRRGILTETPANPQRGFHESFFRTYRSSTPVPKRDPFTAMFFGVSG